MTFLKTNCVRYKGFTRAWLSLSCIIKAYKSRIRPGQYNTLQTVRTALYRGSTAEAHSLPQLYYFSTNTHKINTYDIIMSIRHYVCQFRIHTFTYIYRYLHPALYIFVFIAMLSYRIYIPYLLSYINDRHADISEDK